MNIICFRDQGDVYNAVLFLDIECHKKPNGYLMVLDDQLYTAGIFQSTDFDICRRTFADNYRKHQSVRYETWTTYRTRNPSSLLCDRICGLHVNFINVCLYRYFTQQFVRKCHLQIDDKVNFRKSCIYDYLCSSDRKISSVSTKLKFKKW